jgi:uncharacterized protein (DUF488 family)
VGNKNAESTGEITVWTIGHSTRSAQEFNELLKAHRIETLVDVRAFPSSKRYPQFNKQELITSLTTEGIDYQHFPDLGGRRRASPDSKNIAWTNPSFRAYADYMETDQFKQAVNSLLEVAGVRRTAVMCAEAVWWRCHRSLIADYLKAAGVSVIHIVNATKTENHTFTSAAGIVNGKLSYTGLLSDS